MPASLAMLDIAAHLETYLPWVQVALSLGVLGLCLMFWREFSRTDSRHPGTTDARAPELEKLQKYAAELTRVGENFARLELIPNGPFDSEHSERLLRILQNFNAWLKEAHHRLSISARDEMRGYADDLSALLEQLRSMPQAIPTPQFHGRLEQKYTQVVWEAVRSTDQDIDCRRSPSPLQNALDNLVRVAGMELISPTQGSSYRPAPSDISIRVGEVITRGLRYKNGAIIHPPDIKEMKDYR